MLLGAASPVSVAAATPPAAPAPGPEYGIHAALLGQTTLSHKHFAYSLPPGGSFRDAVVVSNYTDAPLSFVVHGADMVPATGGGMAPAAEGVPSTQVGAWLSMDQASLMVPPHSEVSDGFAIHVPATQKAGSYLGAVVVAQPAPSGSGLAVVTRAALTVELSVLDQPLLAARAAALTASLSGDGEHFTVDVANTGNVVFTFSGDVTVRDGSGQVKATIPLDPANLYVIPGGHAYVRARWDAPPTWGTVTARATIHAAASGVGQRSVDSDTLNLSFFPTALVSGVGAGLFSALLALGVVSRRLRRPS